MFILLDRTLEEKEWQQKSSGCDRLIGTPILIKKHPLSQCTKIILSLWEKGIRETLRPWSLEQC